MKKALLLYMLLSVWFVANSQTKATCSPVKNGKICYSDEVKVNNLSESQLFSIINKWAAKTYGSDLFFSNVSSNKGRGTILISSKMELLLGPEERTYIKFRLRIHCHTNYYTVELTDIVYQYDPDNDKRYKTYPAENVIINEGKGNSVSIIKDPKLFCDATHDFAEKQMGEIFDAVKNNK